MDSPMCFSPGFACAMRSLTLPMITCQGRRRHAHAAPVCFVRRSLMIYSGRVERLHRPRLMVTETTSVPTLNEITYQSRSSQMSGVIAGLAAVVSTMIVDIAAQSERDSEPQRPPRTVLVGRWVGSVGWLY